MRIKIINPTTTEAFTRKNYEAGCMVAAAGTEVISSAVESGPVSIEGHYDEAACVIGILEESPQRRARRRRRLRHRLFRRPWRPGGTGGSPRPGHRDCRGRHACGQHRGHRLLGRDHIGTDQDHRRAPREDSRIRRAVPANSRHRSRSAGARGHRVGLLSHHRRGMPPGPGSRTNPAPSCSAAPAWPTSRPISPRTSERRSSKASRLR